MKGGIEGGMMEVEKAVWRSNYGRGKGGMKEELWEGKGGMKEEL